MVRADAHSMYNVVSCDQFDLEQFLNDKEAEGWSLVQVWHSPTPLLRAEELFWMVILHKDDPR